MSNYFVNNNFHGAIDDKRAIDYYREVIKIEKGNAKENIERMHEILGTKFINDKEFYDEFLTRVFYQNDEEEYNGGIKLILNKDDSLYSESNIAKTLELMGTIIISGEKKRDNPEQYIRVFNSKDMFNKALDELNNIRHIAENSPDGKYAMTNGLDELFVLKNQMNYKLEKRFDKLDDKHLKNLDEEFGSKYPSVHDYYVGYLNMKSKREELMKLKYKKGYFTKEEKTKYRLVSKNIRSLKEDFLDCINKKSRPIVFKSPLPDQGFPDYDMFDELDKTHLKALLQVTKGNDLQDELSVIVRDLENTINECEFTETQWNVLKLLRKDKTQEEISDILYISKPTVNQHINHIVNKIYNKNLEKFTNYYYLNVCKGKYLKCSRCGEIKLVQYFDKNGSRGYKSMCKECRK